MAVVRACKLANTEVQGIDLRTYEEEILQIIEETLPDKHPKVYQDCFTTDLLDRGEAIRLGRALSKNEHLAVLGKTVTTFRLFEGRNVLVNEPAEEEQ